MRLYLTLTLLISCLFSFAQKKKIDHSAYNRWKYISGEQFSNGGKFIAYKEKAYRGNDTVTIQASSGDFELRLSSVKKFGFSYDENSFIALYVNDYDSIRKLKLDEIPKKKWPKDSLQIIHLQKDTILTFKNVKSFDISKKGGDQVLIKRDDSFKIPSEKEKKKKKCLLKRNKKKESSKIKNQGSVITLVNLIDYSFENIPGVTESSMSENGSGYAYVNQFTTNDTIDSAQLHLFFNGNEVPFNFGTKGEIINLNFSEKGDQFACLVSADTGEYKKHQLFLFDNFDLPQPHYQMILDTVYEDFRSHQSILEDGNIQFSKDGKKLFFEVGLKPTRPSKDTLTANEKYKLDLWSWTDGKLQPQQLLSVRNDKKLAVDFVYHTDANSITQVSDTSNQSISYSKYRNSDYALIRDQSKYQKEMTYDFWYYDIYRVNLKTGDKKLLLNHYHGWNSDLSPSGANLCYWNHSDSCWYWKNISSGEEKNITKSISDLFYKSFHDVKQKIDPAGFPEWISGEKAIIINSQTDVWIIPFEGEATRITKGKESNSRFTINPLDYDYEYINLDKGIFLKSINNLTKNQSIYHYKDQKLKVLMEWQGATYKIKQSKENGVVCYQKMSFTESPNVFISDTTFKNVEQISNVNPQQEEYNWATVELTTWKDYKDDSVTGLIYKPEDFDSTKKYPLLVYYYERYSDRLHSYYRPKPTASIIYPTEYASNGYIVLIPDISYELGHPAQSAYNSIMSGTDHMIRDFSYVDSTKMGLQGQSWGGYQTAQLITMTDRFCAAMAGAPVSNMFSAYGGIRWGSGLSRAFQYETGQSRIGASIWDSPELYIENSPVFHLPKVKTPLLIMHNDGDGAVPWYQGIELFSGLRLLNKPVWMLNYNDDEHNLMKDANRMDLSIRMRQFFDHYMLGSKAPQWMKEGIPAIYKGKKNGYELD